MRLGSFGEFLWFGWVFFFLQSPGLFIPFPTLFFSSALKKRGCKQMDLRPLQAPVRSHLEPHQLLIHRGVINLLKLSFKKKGLNLSS